MIQSPPIVDAHLDLAYNASRGRDIRLPATQQPAIDGEIATVSFPDLRAGGVDLVCATIFTEPASERHPNGYRDAETAHAQAMSQLAWYRAQVCDGLMEVVTRGTGLQPVHGLQHGLQTYATGAQRAIILLEGADPIRSPADVQFFYDAGVRIVGLAWKQTRYAGGTGAPGPLTRQGAELVRELDRFGIIHDASHLAEESFYQLLDLTHGPIIASHSNCRAIVPGDRHLSDDMIRKIIERNGVIGINFFDKFLQPPEERANCRAQLSDVVRHMSHICEISGNAKHVGLGTDMDGGLGREQIPVEIETSADLPRVATALSDCGISDQDVATIMSGNWLRYYRYTLTAPSRWPGGG